MLYVISVLIAVVLGYVLPVFTIGIHYGLLYGFLAIVFVFLVIKFIKGPLSDVAISPFIYFAIASSFAVIHMWALLVAGSWLIMIFLESHKLLSGAKNEK